MIQRSAKLTHVRNGQPMRLADVPERSFFEFRDDLHQRVADGGRVLSLFGMPEGSQVRLYAAVGYAQSATITLSTTLVGDSFPSMTPTLPQVHMFEREIAEQWGVVPTGHPWLKPVRYIHSYRPGKDAWGRGDNDPILPCVPQFYRVEGKDIHEVAVGPIHAGVVEPGSFRFQCFGELVYHLEVHHGYQHRGVERKLVGGPNKRTIHYMETASGDQSIGHCTAYCQALEGLSGARVPLKAQAIRGIALELERLACHTGDLGALADDVGFLPTVSYCGRLRGDWLNATAAICGNRFGRSLVVPGGVQFDVEKERAETLIKKLKVSREEVAGAVRLLFETPSVEARFEGTTPVRTEDAKALGFVGMAARMTGIEMDVRRDFPSGIFRFTQIPVSTWHSGDVLARALVRSLETERSGRFVIEQLGELPAGPIKSEVGPLAPDSIVVSLAEPWRGECCHVAITNREGKFAHYKIVDPSFHNWVGMMLALRSQAIFDFPLTNKSFNLSYCGMDL